jgi:hypothetical protein
MNPLARAILSSLGLVVVIGFIVVNPKLLTHFHFIWVVIAGSPSTPRNTSVSGKRSRVRSKRLRCTGSVRSSRPRRFNRLRCKP